MRSLKEWIAWADRCSTVSVVEISPKQCADLRDTLTSLMMEMELVGAPSTRCMHGLETDNFSACGPALAPAPAVKPDGVLLNAPYTPNQEEWRARMDQMHSNPRPLAPAPAVKKTPCAACRGITVDGVEQRVCGRCRGSGVE